MVLLINKELTVFTVLLLDQMKQQLQEKTWLNMLIEIPKEVYADFKENTVDRGRQAMTLGLLW